MKKAKTSKETLTNSRKGSKIMKRSIIFLMSLSMLFVSFAAFAEDENQTVPEEPGLESPIWDPTSGVINTVNVVTTAIINTADYVIDSLSDDSGSDDSGSDDSSSDSE